MGFFFGLATNSVFADWSLSVFINSLLSFVNESVMKELVYIIRCALFYPFFLFSFDLP